MCCPLQMGTMSIDDFEAMCMAGNVNMDVAKQIIDQLRADEQDDIEFLDFLVNLDFGAHLHPALTILCCVSSVCLPADE